MAITYIGNIAAAEKTAAEIEKFGAKAVIIQADISSDSIGETVIQGALKGFGSGILDIVVNNAAFLDLAKWETFMKIASANFHNMFQCNVLAPVKNHPSSYASPARARWSHHQYHLHFLEGGPTR